jgi:hypothetical protein
MLRRLALIAASAGMLAFSALPASAATTHKISFPSLSGVKAWGTYVQTSRGVKLNVCAEDTGPHVFAAAAVAVASNSSGRQTNLGAVAMGYRQTICRTMTLRYTAHLKVYTFTATNTGHIGSKSKTKTIY